MKSRDSNGKNNNCMGSKSGKVRKPTQDEMDMTKKEASREKQTFFWDFLTLKY